MGKFIISVEATADLPKELLAKYDIREAQMNFSIDETEYSTKDENMSVPEFYNKMKAGAKTSTSQINTYSATEYFTELLKEGKDILHVSFTSALSGMYEAMKKSAEELNATSKNKIVVVNSLCASMGQGLLAILCAEKQEEFDTVEKLAEYCESIKMQIDHLFVVDSLKYLSRTGRVSKMTAMIGTALQIKPILHVDNDGHLTSFAKVISRKKSLSSLAEKVVAKKNSLTDKIYICHANCETEANQVKSMIEEKINLNVGLMNLGYVVGCHAGPGTIAVFFTSNER